MNPIAKYFNAEKAESLLFIGFGVSALKNFAMDYISTI